MNIHLHRYEQRQASNIEEKGSRQLISKRPTTANIWNSVDICLGFSRACPWPKKTHQIGMVHDQQMGAELHQMDTNFNES